MKTGYLITDRRYVKTVPELDVKDPDLAEELVGMPASEVDSGIEVYDPPVKKKPVEFDISHLRLHFGEFLKHHSVAKDSKGWTDQFKSLVPGVVGNAGLLMVNNLPVASFRRDGALVMSRLEAEQPQIIAEFTEMVAVPVFNKEKFQAKMPDVYEFYRARSFRLVNAGSGAGLFLS